jgi:hypothetical protein
MVSCEWFYPKEPPHTWFFLWLSNGKSCNIMSCNNIIIVMHHLSLSLSLSFDTWYKFHYYLDICERVEILCMSNYSVQIKEFESWDLSKLFDFKNKFHVVIVNQMAEICLKSSKRNFFINRCAIGNIILYDVKRHEDVKFSVYCIIISFMLVGFQFSPFFWGAFYFWHMINLGII